MASKLKVLLPDEDRDRIRQAVAAAEARTAGEIVPVVVERSYQYPLADVTGAAVMALPVAIGLTGPLGGLLWLGRQNMWVFIGVYALAFVAFHAIVRHTAWLKRLFIAKREIDEEVHEAAITTFFEQGLYRTRDETGVLIFISLFERKVWVLADRGINDRVENNQWDTIVAGIVDGIRSNSTGQAICDAVVKVGRLLESHFPVKDDDTNELADLIVKD